MMRRSAEEEMHSQESAGSHGYTHQSAWDMAAGHCFIRIRAWDMDTE